MSRSNDVIVIVMILQENPKVNGWYHKNKRGDECKTIQDGTIEISNTYDQGSYSMVQAIYDRSLKKVYSLGAPKSTNEVELASISQKQQIGVKRGEAINISQ